MSVTVAGLDHGIKSPMPYRWTSLFIAVVLFPLLTLAEAPPSTSSGIEGMISVSPSRPGPARKDAPSVAPAPNVTFVVKKDDATVKSFTTDGDGRFRVLLPAGHYVVTREDPGAAVGHWRFEADVVAGAMTNVKWTGDSGMR